MCATVARTPEPSDVRTFVMDLVRNNAGMEPQPHQPLSSSGIDSVTLAEVLFEIEEHFKVALGQEAFDLETLDELIEHVDQLSANKRQLPR
ncbi:MAG: acyl carrier protein [Pirellulales bacterium]|nr:acyl carrier protein [Pirellulales bacterium]